MSDPKQLAKAAREHLAQALSALQSAMDIPEELEDTADLIAEAMSAFHKIERGGTLDGRSEAFRKVRRALDRFLDWPLPLPVLPSLVDASASALAKAYALAKWSGEQTVRAELTPPPPAIAPAPIAPIVPVAPAPILPVAPAPIAPAPILPVAPAPIAPAPIVPVAPAPIAPAPILPVVPAPTAPKPVPITPVPVPVPAPIAAPKPLLSPVIELPPAPQPAPAKITETPAPKPAAPKPAPEKRETLPAPPAGTPSLDVELTASSASNFYRGLLGNDVVESGGIFVATYKIPKIGALIALRVQLPGGFSFEAHAIVQWTRAMGNALDSADPGFGARITLITQEGRHLIERYTRNREPIFFDDL